MHCCSVVFVTKASPTLCSPVDCSLPGSSVLGMLRARILEWVVIYIVSVNTACGYFYCSLLLFGEMCEGSSNRVRKCFCFSDLFIKHLLSTSYIYTYMSILTHRAIFHPSTPLACTSHTHICQPVLLYF